LTKFAASPSIVKNVITKHLITILTTLVLGFMTANAFAQSDTFTFEPGGRATLKSLVYPHSHDRCGIYSLNIPVTFETTGNILDNLLDGGPNEFAEIFVGDSGQLCGHGEWVFTARYPESTLKLSKTKALESVHYSSKALCGGGFNPIPVGLQHRYPILLKLNVKRSNGKGSLALKGVVPDLQYPFPIPGRTLIQPPEVDVMLVLGATDGSDSNSGIACITVPLKLLK
jgi:hypothetical protein